MVKVYVKEKKKFENILKHPKSNIDAVAKMGAALGLAIGTALRKKKKKL